MRTLAQFQVSEMKMRGQSKVSSFAWFCVWCKLRKLRGRFKDSKIPLCNPRAGKNLLRPSASSNKLLEKVASKILPNIQDGALLQKFVFSQRAKDVDYFCKKAPSQMFDWIPNAPSIEKVL